MLFIQSKFYSALGICRCFIYSFKKVSDDFKAQGTMKIIIVSGAWGGQRRIKGRSPACHMAMDVCSETVRRSGRASGRALALVHSARLAAIPLMRGYLSRDLVEVRDELCSVGGKSRYRSGLSARGGVFQKVRRTMSGHLGQRAGPWEEEPEPEERPYRAFVEI